MSVLDFLRESFRYMKWADAEIWKTAFDTTDAETDSELRDRFLHIHVVQQGFFHVWRGAAFDFQAAMQAHSELNSISSWAEQYHIEVADFLATLDEAALDRPVELPWAGIVTARMGREPKTPTLQDTLHQVVMHTIYHRGQVATRLRGLGSEPPTTDFIVWVWVGRPEPVWPTPKNTKSDA